MFDPVRPWLGADSLERLNACAEAAGIRTESGCTVRFVPPGPSDPYYEIGVYESGRVATRAGNLHDWFNALAWLAFPRTKARLNAMHAAEIPREAGRRGRLAAAALARSDPARARGTADLRLPAMAARERQRCLL